jgi:hypothetical protein
MNETCGCCDGVQALTPLTIANRPGLDALLYRIGAHGSFLETMIARLSNLALDVPLLNEFDAQGQQKTETLYPLQQLTTRVASDAAIAFLDAWATVADVLTFYQERIANEGYLRTATERRSIIELARLVGYKLRPGVAASVYLAYTLEKDHNVVILPGNRTQSVPDPGEKAQAFETAEKLEARFAWNTLTPRQTRPQVIDIPILAKTPDPAIYLQGTATNIKQGDPLLLLVAGYQRVILVKGVKPQPLEKRTQIILNFGAAAVKQAVGRSKASSTRLADIVTPLGLAPSLQPKNTQRLGRDVAQTFSAQSDIHLQMLSKLVPQLQNTLYSAVANAAPVPAVPTDETSVQAFRVQAAPFGYNAPLVQVNKDGRVVSPPHEWFLAGCIKVTLSDVIIGIQSVTVAPENDPPVFSGNVPFNYAVALVKEDGTQKSSGDNPVTDDIKDIQIDLDAQRVLVNIKLHDEKSGKRFQQGTFAFLDLQHTITITRDGENWTVQFDETSFPVTPNQLLTKVIEKGGKARASLKDIFEISLCMVPERNVLTLDAQYDRIVQGSWVVVERSAQDKSILFVEQVQIVYKADYGISARVTQLILDHPWLNADNVLLSDIRGIVVYAQSEQQTLTEVPIEDDIAAIPVSSSNAQLLIRAAATPVPATTENGTDTIELDQIYDGLKSGQRLIVSGERTDVPGPDGRPIRGIFDGELVMLKAVKQDASLPGDTPHTFLFLANKLRFTYRRDNLVIYANVVRATHGETRNEVLGSGAASQELQAFTLRQFPLTYVSASTPSGVASTLEVRANGLLWHEADSLTQLQATDRGYSTTRDDADKTTITFGNGVFGARLPTGIENISATYRSSIGQAGNVRAGQITLLSTKPLGVKGVVNPLQASGGADSENRDQARNNVPLAALALDRLVAVEDYEHFARTFGGIGKASAAPLPDGRRQLVHVTIVGADNAPILKTSDLYINLSTALRQSGDPNEPLIVALAEVLFLVVSANVHLLPDYLFENVEPKIRSTLLATFGFERRALGQSLFQSEVISAIQQVTGVDYVELEVMGALSQAIIVQAVDAELTEETVLSETDDAAVEDITEEESESIDVEKAEEFEEFLEALGLTGVQDVTIQLARPDKDNPLASGGIAPAQLAFLSPDVPDTLILAELP